MAASFTGVGSGGAQSGSSVNIGIPGGITAAGQLVVSTLWVAWNGTTLATPTAVTPPAGWQLATNPDGSQAWFAFIDTLDGVSILVAPYFHWSTGAESSLGNYNFTFATVGGNSVGDVGAYAKLIATTLTGGNPYQDPFVHAFSAAGTTSLSTTSFTPANNNTLIMADAFWPNISTAGTPAGWTADATYLTGGSDLISAKHITQTTATATGAVTFTGSATSAGAVLVGTIRDAIAVDPFTGTNGAAWGALWAVTNTSGGTVDIQSNKGRMLTGAASYVGEVAYCTGMAAVSTLWDVTVDLTIAAHASEQYVVVAAQVQAADAGNSEPANGYFVELAVGNNTFSLAKNGTSVSGDVPFTFADGVLHVEASRVGSTINVYLYTTTRPGTPTYTYADPSPYNTAGKVNLAFGNGNTSGALTALWDNFQVTGGALVTGVGVTGLGTAGSGSARYGLLVTSGGAIAGARAAGGGAAFPGALLVDTKLAGSPGSGSAVYGILTGTSGPVTITGFPAGGAGAALFGVLVGQGPVSVAGSRAAGAGAAIFGAVSTLTPEVVYLFTPPQRVQTNLLHGKSLVYKTYISLTVYKINGVWVAEETPADDTLQLADQLLAVSGRPQIVDADLANELIAAGIGTIEVVT